MVTEILDVHLFLKKIVMKRYDPTPTGGMCLCKSGDFVKVSDTWAIIDQIDKAIDTLDPSMSRQEIVELRESLIRFRSRDA